MTTVVLDPSDPEILTNNRESDAKSSLCRGLAEYLASSVKIDPSRGLEQVTLRKVVDMYAEPEVLSEYPSASVNFIGDGEYDQGSFETIQISKEESLVVLSSFTQDLQVEIWCTNPTERALFTAATEDALDPVDFMCGLRLTLDHYFGTRATYMVKSVDFDDSDQQNMRRYRIAKFVVTGTVSRLRLVSNTPLDPRAAVVATNPQDIDPEQE